MQLVRAKRPDNEHPLFTEIAQQKEQNITRGAVRPMQVLDDEHQRRTGRNP